MSIRDRIVELRRAPARSLVPHPENWRRHPARQQRILSDLLEEIGFADAIIARELEDGGLQIIDGHLRAEVSGEEEVPVLVLDVDEEEARKLLLSLDPLAGLAESAKDRLAELIEATEAGSAGLRELLAQLSPVALESLQDEVPEPPKHPVTKPGDLWVLDGSAVLCADSRDEAAVGRALGTVGRPDALITDPPYGVSYRGVGGKRRAIAGDELRAGELRELVAGAIKALGELPPGAPAYVFTADSELQTMREALQACDFVPRQNLVWVKDRFVLGRMDYHAQHESIIYAARKGGKRPWFGARRASALVRDAGEPRDLPREELVELVEAMAEATSSVQRADRPTTSPDHPTTKPVPLLARLMLNSTERGELIADPFAGSGSTLVAAVGLERRCLAVEVDPAYVDVAVMRLGDVSGHGPQLA